MSIQSGAVPSNKQPIEIELGDFKPERTEKLRAAQEESLQARVPEFGQLKVDGEEGEVRDVATNPQPSNQVRKGSHVAEQVLKKPIVVPDGGLEKVMASPIAKTKNEVRNEAELTENVARLTPIQPKRGFWSFLVGGSSSPKPAAQSTQSEEIEMREIPLSTKLPASTRQSLVFEDEETFKNNIRNFCQPDKPSSSENRSMAEAYDIMCDIRDEAEGLSKEVKAKIKSGASYQEVADDLKKLKKMEEIADGNISPIATKHKSNEAHLKINIEANTVIKDINRLKEIIEEAETLTNNYRLMPYCLLIEEQESTVNKLSVSIKNNIEKNVDVKDIIEDYNELEGVIAKLKLAADKIKEIKERKGLSVEEDTAADLALLTYKDIKEVYRKIVESYADYATGISFESSSLPVATQVAAAASSSAAPLTTHQAILDAAALGASPPIPALQSFASSPSQPQALPQPPLAPTVQEQPAPTVQNVASPEASAASNAAAPADAVQASAASAASGNPITIEQKINIALAKDNPSIDDITSILGELNLEVEDLSFKIRGIMGNVTSTEEAKQHLARLSALKDSINNSIIPIIKKIESQVVQIQPIDPNIIDKLDLSKKSIKNVNDTVKQMNTLLNKFPNSSNINAGKAQGMLYDTSSPSSVNVSGSPAPAAAAAAAPPAPVQAQIDSYKRISDFATHTLEEYRLMLRGQKNPIDDEAVEQLNKVLVDIGEEVSFAENIKRTYPKDPSLIHLADRMIGKSKGLITEIKNALGLPSLYPENIDSEAKSLSSYISRQLIAAEELINEMNMDDPQDFEDFLNNGTILNNLRKFSTIRDVAKKQIAFANEILTFENGSDESKALAKETIKEIQKLIELCQKQIDEVSQKLSNYANTNLSESQKLSDAVIENVTKKDVDKEINDIKERKSKVDKAKDCAQFILSDNATPEAKEAVKNISTNLDEIDLLEKMARDANSYLNASNFDHDKLSSFINFLSTNTENNIGIILDELSAEGEGDIEIELKALSLQRKWARKAIDYAKQFENSAKPDPVGVVEKNAAKAIKKISNRIIDQCNVIETAASTCTKAINELTLSEKAHANAEEVYNTVFGPHPSPLDPAAKDRTEKQIESVSKEVEALSKEVEKSLNEIEKALKTQRAKKPLDYPVIKALVEAESKATEAKENVADAKLLCDKARAKIGIEAANKIIADATPDINDPTKTLGSSQLALGETLEFFNKNNEVYNAPELTAELESNGVPPTPQVEPYVLGDKVYYRIKVTYTIKADSKSHPTPPRQTITLKRTISTFSTDPLEAVMIANQFKDNICLLAKTKGGLKTELQDKIKGDGTSTTDPEEKAKREEAQRYLDSALGASYLSFIPIRNTAGVTTGFKSAQVKDSKDSKKNVEYQFKEQKIEEQKKFGLTTQNLGVEGDKLDDMMMGVGNVAFATEDDRNLHQTGFAINSDLLYASLVKDSTNAGILVKGMIKKNITDNQIAFDKLRENFVKTTIKIPKTSKTLSAPSWKWTPAAEKMHAHQVGLKEKANTAKPEQDLFSDDMKTYLRTNASLEKMTREQKMLNDFFSELDVGVTPRLNLSQDQAKLLNELCPKVVPPYRPGSGHPVDRENLKKIIEDTVVNMEGDITKNITKLKEMKRKIADEHKPLNEQLAGMIELSRERQAGIAALGALRVKVNDVLSNSTDANERAEAENLKNVLPDEKTLDKEKEELKKNFQMIKTILDKLKAT